MKVRDNNTDQKHNNIIMKTQPPGGENREESEFIQQMGCLIKFFWDGPWQNVGRPYPDLL